MAESTRAPYGSGRDALIDATIEVVADKGLKGMTFRAVGEAAGVNNALIARYFGNREGLLAAALDRTIDNAITSTEPSRAFEDPERFTRELERATVVDRQSLLFQYELILEASRNEAFREPVAHLYRAYLTAFTDHTADLPEAFSRAWFAIFDGLVLQLLSGSATPEQFTESLRIGTEIIGGETFHLSGQGHT